MVGVHCQHRITYRVCVKFVGDRCIFLFWADNLNVLDHSEWSAMEPTLESLEFRRKELHRSLEALGDFRRGTISVNFRRCGKSNCACAQEHHPGHGPQYLWNASVGGKTKARNLPLGPELEKVQKEVERYREFDRLCQELVMVNEQICQLRPARILADEDELEQLKKNCGGVSPRGGSGSRPPDWAHARRPPAAWPSGFGSQRNSDSGGDASIG